MNTTYHITVFGGGSVGLCLAAHFAIAGARVSLLVRAGSVAGLTDKPIEVSGLLGDHVVPAGAITVCDAAQPGADILDSDMMILTTKAYDVGSALKPFAEQGRCPPVLLLQNGMGSAEIARAALGPDVALFSAAIMIGMVRHNPTYVEVSAQPGPIICGPLLGCDPAPLVRMLAVSQDGFVPMEHDPDIRNKIAFKLLLNSCLNPTGAMTGLTYGGLLQNPASRALITGLADETLAAYASAYDYRPATSGAHYVDEVLSPMVFPHAQDHRSSMLQDLQAGRRTEIDFLNGAIARLAQAEGLETPRHDSIIQLIKASEAAKG